MTSFDDPALAQRTRDAMVRLMIRTLDQERPPYQYGEVTQIDPDLGSCRVLLNGDTTDVEIKYGAIRPAFVGQVVRVSGKRGDRFISDVIGGSIVADAPTNQLVAPIMDLVPDISGVLANWTTVVGAFKYEVQFSQSSTFASGVSSFITFSTQSILPNLTAGTTYYARSRALTSSNQTGPWSNTDSAVVGTLTYQPHDGIAPSASPTPVISAGIGFLLAEWIATPNADPVTYEVHVSASSGFTPTSGTLIGETSTPFYFIRHLGSASGNAVLTYGTTYFVRLVAKDADGSAAVGAQGSGATLQVQTADVGRIATSEIGDGSAPPSSPTPVIINGIGYLYATWTHVANADAVTYEVHVSTASGFTPVAGTLIGTTPSNFTFIRNVGPTAGGGPLVYGTLYYVRLVAKDVDGVAAVGVQASGTPVQTNTPDIAVGSITAASAILANLAVETAKIADANITTAKIADLNVSTAKIANLAVQTAKIDDLAVSTAKIANLAVTDAKIDTLTASKITTGTLAAQTITVGASGAIQSSDYVVNTSGWKIAMGLAEFNGATIIGSTIVAGEFHTSLSGQRTVMGASFDGLEFWSQFNASFLGTDTPAKIICFDETGGTYTGRPILRIEGPRDTNANAPQPYIDLVGGTGTLGDIKLSASGAINFASASVDFSQSGTLSISGAAVLLRYLGNTNVTVDSGGIHIHQQVWLRDQAFYLRAYNDTNHGFYWTNAGGYDRFQFVTFSRYNWVINGTIRGYLNTTEAYFQDYVYAWGGSCRIGELYSNTGIYAVSGTVRVDAASGNVYLSIGGSVKFQCNTNGYNYSYNPLSMEGNSLYYNGAGDTNQRVFYHSGYDAPLVHGWGSPGVWSMVGDIQGQASSASYWRCVNVANNAWRDVGAANIAGYSDPSSKRNMQTIGRGTALTEIRKAKPFRFKWKDGEGDSVLPEVVGGRERPGREGRTWMGLSSHEVPEDMQIPMHHPDNPDSGLMGINVMSAIAYLWGGVGDVADDVEEKYDAMIARIEELAAAVAALKQKDTP